MDLDLDQLAEAVLRLPDAARADLATRLLASLELPDAGEAPEAVAAAWEIELDRREADLAADPSLGLSQEEFFERVAANLADRRNGRKAPP